VGSKVLSRAQRFDTKTSTERTRGRGGRSGRGRQWGGLPHGKQDNILSVRRSLLLERRERRREGTPED